ncbi:NACHT domain-containing protein [Nonomuraea sp. K274]|uniref:NACHT domain-containing protein n=1 Tax=Nonomuraea cypriaca TaxID=1187855 RepID=A0A931A7I8_9ACTN|nr:NACHT domain-containing protein [Nonomuraea cypriaca]MBF8187827.1 NACHT domain-containing protein [Nonomuraea cypriaca]
MVATSILVPFIAIAVVVLFVSQGREYADQWASIFSFVVTALVASAAMIGWLRQRAKRRGDLGTLDVAELGADAVAAHAERLAVKVEQVWKSEELRQRLLDPEPLPVSWRTIGPPVSDHWRVIGDNDLPIDLDGSLDDLYHTIHTKLPRTRLVVLGEPGAGKTSLVMRFALACLSAREQAGPVPVILRLSTWTPSNQLIIGWIYARLVEDYGYDLAEPLSLDRLLLILDGLDEMPASEREQALIQINAAFSARYPLVLTSRTAEYLATIGSQQADVLTAAAAIEIKPLDAAAIRDYLTITTKPARLPEWSNVFAELTANPDGELAHGLSTPLALSLARVAYAERAANPDHLLTFTIRRDLEAHLLNELVPALYSGSASHHGRNPSGYPSRSGRSSAYEQPNLAWRPDAAHHWLSFLARHFGRRGISSLELIDVVPPWVYGVILGLLSGLCAGTAFDVAAGPAWGALLGTAMAIATFVYVFAQDRREPPPTSQVMSWIATSAFFVFVFGLFTMGADLRADQGVVIALGAALWLQVTLSRGLIALQVGLLDMAVVHTAVTRPSVSPETLTLAALVTILAVSVLSAFRLRLLLARAMLAASGQLPWRVATFLDDGYQRGVLRQVGDLYYFRHDLLRQQLTHKE